MSLCCPFICPSHASVSLYIFGEFRTIKTRAGSESRRSVIRQKGVLSFYKTKHHFSRLILVNE